MAFPKKWNDFFKSSWHFFCRKTPKSRQGKILLGILTMTFSLFLFWGIFPKNSQKSPEEFVPPPPHEKVPLAVFQGTEKKKKKIALEEFSLSPEQESQVLVAIEEVEKTAFAPSAEIIEEYQEIKQEIAEKSESFSSEEFREKAQEQRNALLEINEQIQQDFLTLLTEKTGDAEIATKLVGKGIAEPNFVYELLESSSDPSFPEQWSIPFVMNQQTENKTTETTTKPIIVAIIDTGVDVSHEDLTGQFWTDANCLDENGIPIVGGCLGGGYDFVKNDSDPTPSDGQTHGTAVAGVLGAVSNNGKGIASFGEMTSPKTIRLMALRTCCTEQGFFEAYAIERAIYFAVQNGARIINMSLGGPTPSERIKQAIAYANANGVLVVVAAGNYGSDNDLLPMYPANIDLPNVLSVGALASDGALASFSNYGKNTVDIAFPGKGILSTLPGNRYGIVNGTSFAAPLASAVLAVFVR